MASKSQARTLKQPAMAAPRSAGTRAAADRAPAPNPDPDPVKVPASPARKRKAPKPVVKAAAAPAAAAVLAAKAAADGAGKKANKPRPVLVRDSFTMPEADFSLIARLKTTALQGQRAAKKSELLRAGLQLLAGLDTESLVVALNRLDAVKTGRPKKGH